MPQTVPATASLGPIYATTPTVGYRVLALDGSVATAYTTANVVSLGGGFYRVTGGVSAPEAGGIIQWWSNNPASGGVLLAVAAVEVASGLTNAQEIKLNELYRKAGLDPAAPVTRTLNPSTGNVAETFTGVAINHVEAGTTVVTTRQT